ncbi:MAG: hypothetical protein AB1898_04020 [Acidobacteriota bacterium]
MGKSLVLLKGLLWFVAGFHMIVGTGLNVSPGLMQFMADFYGAQVDWTPQFVYILKPLGAFMFVMGMMAAAAARDPLNNRPIVLGFVSLFLIRAAQRPLFANDIYSAFAVPPARNLSNMILFFVLAGALFFLFRRARKAAQG